MDIVNDNTATPNEEPVAGEANGSDPTEALSGNTGTEDSGGTNLNDKAFKGLQRRISAKDQEIQTLKSQIAEIKQSSTASGGLDERTIRLIQPLVQRIAKDDPDYARQWAAQVQAQLLAEQNRQLEEEVNSKKNQAKKQQEEAAVLADLRALAAELGVDPDSDLLDYGDETMELRERMTLVRQSVADAKKAAKPTAPKPAPSSAATHNTNPGVPPTAKPAPKTYTRNDLQTALAEYRAKPSTANLARANEIRQALIKSMEESLPKTM